ncbi:hypothetical protein C9374_009422 [Naegleria lovaniensis]|uniref:Uncharacterized protein n=1 Tax=Naegleria lovaniensis TaxID=51637 RepID=A0AA88KWV1_NAELO|nr:uncharacterized protein C9374_009422 [Naegleria lovaniensis]KAG2392845.1 hypothetical protein C9374_009422 [Naegleria lovaniensis]
MMGFTLRLLPRFTVAKFQEEHGKSLLGCTDASVAIEQLCQIGSSWNDIRVEVLLDDDQCTTVLRRRKPKIKFTQLPPTETITEFHLYSLQEGGSTGSSSVFDWGVYKPGKDGVFSINSKPQPGYPKGSTFEKMFLLMELGDGRFAVICQAFTYDVNSTRKDQLVASHCSKKKKKVSKRSTHKKKQSPLDNKKRKSQDEFQEDGATEDEAEDMETSKKRKPSPECVTSNAPQQPQPVVNSQVPFDNVTTTAYSNEGTIPLSYEASIVATTNLQMTTQVPSAQPVVWFAPVRTDHVTTPSYQQLLTALQTLWSVPGVIECVNYWYWCASLQLFGSALSQQHAEVQHLTTTPQQSIPEPATDENIPPIENSNLPMQGHVDQQQTEENKEFELTQHLDELLGINNPMSYSQHADVPDFSSFDNEWNL